MLKMVSSLLYNILSYWKFDDSSLSEEDKDSAVICNHYIFLLFLIFLFQAIFNIFFVKNIFNAIFLAVLSFLFFFCFIFLRDILLNKYFKAVLFIFLTSLITFHSFYYGIESATFIYYFPLITAVYILFSWKDNKFLILFLMVYIVLSLYISALLNFDIFDSDHHSAIFSHKLLILNITCMLMFLALNLFCIVQKREQYYFTRNRNLQKRQQIEILHSEIQHLKKTLNKEAFSDETLRELIDSIQLSDVIFIDKFDFLFPDFFNKINRISEDTLNLSDLKMCALLKLGFSGKQIAIYTNSSTKSVEGKIYRLRKKFNLSADVDSKVWFSSI